MHPVMSTAKLSEKRRAAQMAALSRKRGSGPRFGYCYFRVAYAPAAWPSVKWALKPPKMPVGRSSAAP